MKSWSVRVLGLAGILVLGVAPTAFAGGAPPVLGDSCGIFQTDGRLFSLINENVTGAPVAVSTTFGPSANPLTPLPGDFNDNGMDTFAVYDHTEGLFYLNNTNTGGTADQVVRFGGKNRQPPASPLIGIQGDWQGTGNAGIGLYDPDAGTFTLQFVPADGGQVDAFFPLGNGGQGNIPFVFDDNFDGVDTVGIYSPTSGEFTWKAGNNEAAPVTTIRFGGTGTSNLPFAGDFDNDTFDTVGLYIPGSHTFMAADSNVDGGGTVNVFKFGGDNPSIVPVCGDWDGM